MVESLLLVFRHFVVLGQMVPSTGEKAHEVAFCVALNNR